ncbi:DUF3298 domain-containing protein [Acinetobacter indicus]|uniref:RsiV family protein n=1 Tax=Acinetobacter indicus TaxID=756892 RepID=UPI00257904A7|nr:RsiV family protein [Acinetobacter indicus]MDM1277114.1 DUF3298 domain-containing protein [Acinetobacter indicus]
MLKQKTAWVMSVLAVSMALTACQPKNNEPKQEQQAQAPEVEQQALKLIGEPEKLQLNLPECEGKNCPELSVERLQSNQPFVDEQIDQYILKELNQTLEIAPADKPLNVEAPASAAEPASSAQALTQIPTPKQKLEQQVQPFIAAFLSLDQEIKALSANHQISLMIKPKILNSEGPLATVVVNSSSYLGGAHGATAQTYFNFDLEQKKQVKLADILQPKQRAALEAAAYEAFKQWVVDSKLANNVAEYEQAWKFKLSDNFYLGQQGLILQYAEYEIGPYVVGLPRLMIPYTELQQVLKKPYLPAPEAPASEATTAAASSADAKTI